MMTNSVEWMTELAQAAADLGYGIASLTPNEVELVPLLGMGDRNRITIEAYGLSGQYLRKVLQPVRVRQEVPA